MKHLFFCSILALFSFSNAQASIGGSSHHAASSYGSMAIAQLTNFANSGDKNAQFFLANRYKAGSGVIRDLNKAFDWFMASAKQGAAPAQLNVGQMYATGKGVKKDLTQAQKWLEMAARQGDNRASYNLALLNERSKDLASAYKWYELTARPEMLSDSVRQLARTKLMKLTSKLSQQDIKRAQDAAHSWFQTN